MEYTKIFERIFRDIYQLKEIKLVKIELLNCN